MKRLQKTFLSLIIALMFPAFLKAQPGAALNFDGVNDEVFINNSTLGALTIEFWMRTTQTGPTGYQWHFGNGLVDAEVTGVQNDFGTSLLGSKLAFGIGNPDITLLSTSNVNTGNWVHVAAVYTSGIGKIAYLYINGQLEAQSTAVGSGARNTNAQIAFGRMRSKPQFFNGDLDEVRVWNYTRSQCQIRSHMNCELTSTEPGLLYYYQFNQGTAGGTNTAITNVTNLMGGNNGTMNNFAKTGTSSNFIAPGAVISGVSCPQAFISVQSNSTIINDNATTTTTLNNTNFGTVCSALTPITNTYTIYNNLMTPLSVGNFTITGTGASSFSVSTLPSSTIAPSSSAVFGISFFPTTTGAKTAAISFTTDNCNATTYNFALSASVIVSPTITVNSGSICSGNSFVINASGASTYTFSGGSSTVSPNSTTTYTITGTNTVGCVNSNTAVSTVSVIPSPTISISSAAICYGQSYTLSPSGASSYTYSSGPVVSPSVITSYSVTGSNFGCPATNTAVATITVNPMPSINVSQTNTLICSGQTTTLNASGATTYSWSTGNTTASVIISPSITTIYTVTGTSLGCSSVYTITQNVSPCTAISENLLKENLKVYPNPTNGMIIVELVEETDLILKDITGRIIYETNLNTGKHRMDLNNYSKGIYFIIFTNQKESGRLKLVIE